MSCRRTRVRPERAWLVALCLGAAAFAPNAAEPTRVRFSLPHESVTSAGLYDAEGRLLRTLWSGERLAAGEHVRSIETDAAAVEAVGPVARHVTLIHHNVRPVWEGVVGNSSAVFVGRGIHRALYPPTGLAIAGERVYYATGFNEGQRALHAFEQNDPQRDLQPFDYIDTFAAITHIATDGKRVYAANTGGLSKTTFVMAFDIARQRPHEWPQGHPLCLNRRPNNTQCFSHDYRGVIGLETDPAHAPNGLAVQSNGPLLAVARATRQLVQFFDKSTGQHLGDLRVALDPKVSNPLAFAPDGDLWVISAGAVHRYTQLSQSPQLAATISGLSAPLAVAVAPHDRNAVWVADGGASQQVKRFDRSGNTAANRVLGVAGGYALDPRVQPEKLCFMVAGKEQTALAAAADGSLWVVDTCNNRMLRWRADGSVMDAVAYLPASYAATADPHDPGRVFANFLEFRIDANKPLMPGPDGWTLVRNWLPGLPPNLRDAQTENRAFAGFRAVTTMSNGRTYGLLGSGGRDALVELPAQGALRVLRVLAPPAPGATQKVLYENGDIGWALVGGGRQTILRQRLTGFDDKGDPQWAAEPERLVSVPTSPGSPHDRRAWTGVIGPRFPVAASERVVFFDPSVTGNDGFHLGAAKLGAQEWLWMASPSAPLDGRGSFQTLSADRLLRRTDRGIQYGGNVAYAHERHIVFGFHGEFYTDQSNGLVGQANQFMHFHDSGLFIAQLGVPSTRATMEAQAGLSGNAFSPALVASRGILYLYHNDESSHGGVHRWRIDGWKGVHELRGTGETRSIIDLR